MSTRVEVELDSDSDSSTGVPEQLVPWDEFFWIRPSDPRIYPAKNVPPEVENRRKFLLELPEAAEDLLPPNRLPITRLLGWYYHPKPRQALIPTQVKFTNNLCDPNPNAITRVLERRPTFPPLSVVNGLEKAFGQAWFNGSTALQDSYFEPYALPFWSMTFWRRLDRMHSIRSKWFIAESVLASYQHKDQDTHIAIRQVVDHITILLQQIAWYAPLCGFPITGWRPETTRVEDVSVNSDEYDQGAVFDYTPVFLQFIGNNLLNDEALNMMLQFLRLHVQRGPELLSRVVIADLGFTQRLLLEFSDSPTQKSRHLVLKCHGELLTELGRTQLFCIVNPGGHWAVIKIDVTTRSVSYGDSLLSHGSSYDEAIAAAIRWANHVFPLGRRFVKGAYLPCNTQKDGVSCGITACSMISNSIGLDSEAWSAKKAVYWWLLWTEWVMSIHVQASGPLVESSQSEMLETLETLETLEDFPFTVDAAVLGPPPAGSTDSRRLALSSLLNNSELVLTLDVETLNNSLEEPLSQLQIEANGIQTRGPEAFLLSNANASSAAPNVLLDTIAAQTLETDLTLESGSPLIVSSDTGVTNPMVELEAGDAILPSYVSYVDDAGVLHLTSDESEQEEHYSEHVLATPNTPPSRSLGKHKRTISVDSDLVTAVSAKHPAISKLDTCPEERACGPVGISRAALLDRANKEALASGILKITQQRRQKFLKALQVKDPHATLDEDDPTCRTVIHSKCGKRIMVAMLRTGKFTRHVDTCTGSKLRKNAGRAARAAASTPNLGDMFTNMIKSMPSTCAPHSVRSDDPLTEITPTPSPPPSESVLCAGLRVSHEPKVAHMAQRGPLGGRLDLNTLAKKKFGKDAVFSKLPSLQKETIHTAWTATSHWIVHYEPIPHVRSSQCQTQCNPEETQAHLSPKDICTNCANLLTIREFRTALNRTEPEPENLKFVPYSNRNKGAAMVFARYSGLSEIINQASAGRSPLMVLVTKTLSGKLKGDAMYMGFMEAMAIKVDKITRGKGLENFKRSPVFVAFCQRALLLSPQTYRLLKLHFPLPSERNLRWHRSRAPPFPLGITDRTIARAKNYLETLDYSGPVCLACDDTQLLSRFTPYYDGLSSKWFLLGGVGDPIEVDGGANDGTLDETILKAVQVNEKATKIRVWCLQVPTPGVPVFILAAIPIGSSTKAPALLGLHNKLVNGLLDSGICLVSYSCDGSATERKLVTQFLETATSTTTRHIPDPRPDFPPKTVVIHHFGASQIPMIPIQDCKHAIKNARNALYSGSRTMILGNCVINYLMILMLSVSPRSPLYQRDVLKVDRQDDRAAMRLFSAGFIQFILEIAQEQIDGAKFQMASMSSVATKDLPDPSLVLRPQNLIALAIWLFVFGDAFDAFQSRSLPIYDRLLMVLRLHYFLEIWKASLKSLGYSESLHFISREYYAIISNLIDGFLGLVYVYRDILECSYALSPWLHSTEGNEHTFGEARRIKPDFTVSDFLSLVAKLEATSISALHDADLEHDLKARAAGYHHTLYSRLGVDMKAMSCFPPDSLIPCASRVAHEEAVALFSRSGIAVTLALCPPPSSPKTATASSGGFVAPSISEWFQQEEHGLDADDWFDPNMACDLEDESPQLAGEIEKLICEADHYGCAPLEMEREMDGYAAAAIALEAEDEHQLMNIPDRSEEGDWKATRQHIRGALKHSNLAPVVLADDVNYKSLLGDESRIDLSQLVKTRSANESHFAKQSVRTGAGVLKPEASITTTLSTTSARATLAKKIHGVLKRLDDAGVVSTSGASRISRHEGRFETEAAQPGNAANAAAAAKARDTSALTTRRNAFCTAKFKCALLLEAAGVSSLVRISTGSFVFVLVDNQVWLAEVVTMYSKGAGKGGKHSWVNHQTNIASLSGVVVQLWEYWAGREFNVILQTTVRFFACRFAHIPSARVLYVAGDLKPERLGNGNIVLSKSSFAIWTGFDQEKAGISEVIAKLLKRSK